MTAVRSGPPDSELRFDFADLRFQQDPWPLYAWHREHQPVHWSEPLASYVVVGHEHVRRALTSADFTVYHPFRVSRRAFGPSMLDTDGPRHAPARRCVSSVLRPRAVDALAQEVIAPIARRLVTAAVRDGDPHLADSLARDLPMRVVCRVMGLPEQDAPELHQMMRPLVAYVDHDEVPLAEVTEHRRHIRDYFHDALVRGTGDGALLSAMVAEDSFDRTDLVNNAILLLAAGTETTAGAITALLARVVSEDGLFDALRADRTQVRAVVQETLRHEPPLHVTLRFAAKDLTIAGTDLPAGAPVQVCLASANRDPEVFADPDRWDPGRPARTNLSFGVGRHICLGMGLAQAELEVLLEVLLDELRSLEADGAVPAMRGRSFRHATGLRLRYRLAPASDGVAP
ncbi:cytochrome P450 [Actinoplanes xinjiangensis]|uniref:Cytochrome P450 n=1 Tax=Actinoplanes xinjiangensis TaxID=512350 RepID=A0A316EV28_9ACTN|nr:cytochrome P450 [Actinoplanes xinjiangensis]PWK36086.1 cytochrome P450 [Actinoplanes xinjiangensis]GIF42910.1 hypothetical protein Axi01nite_72210 [Actinoplanes xinjiangensis]